MESCFDSWLPPPAQPRCSWSRESLPGHTKLSGCCLLTPPLFWGGAGSISHLPHPVKATEEPFEPFQAA